MKKIVVSAVFLLGLAACQKKTPPVPADNSTAENAMKMEDELRSLEQQEEKLKREIELERLALEREDLRLQRENLSSKKDQLSAEQLALEAKKSELALERERMETEKAREQNRPLPVQPAAPAPVVIERPVSSAPMGDYDYSVFYDRLAPHGSWFQSADYGYVWRPAVLRGQPDWRPYVYGSWAYSDLGWTWVSTEPFGWATYHYGRWVSLRNTGWCWIPGNQWAPAWVCWKSSGSYIGWAPLPAESLYWTHDEFGRFYGAPSGISPHSFAFVRSNSFGGPIHQSILSGAEGIRVYQSTQYIGGYQFQNRRVICQGVNYQVASQAYGHQIPRYELEFNNRPPTSLDPVRHAATRGNRLSMNAPNFNVPWNGALRPRQIERTLGDEEVVREKGFDKNILTNFTRERGNDERRAKTAIRSGLAQKMTQRIALEEKITQQREEIAKDTGVAPPETTRPNRKSPFDRDNKTPGMPSRPSVDKAEPGDPVIKPMDPTIPPAADGPKEPADKADDKPAADAEQVPTVPPIRNPRPGAFRPDRGNTKQPGSANPLREQQQKEAQDELMDDGKANEAQAQESSQKAAAAAAALEAQKLQQDAMREQQKKSVLDDQEQKLRNMREKKEARDLEMQQEKATRDNKGASIREEQQQRQQAAMKEQQDAVAAREEQQRQQAVMKEQQDAAAAREEQQRQQAAMKEQQDAVAAREEQQRQLEAMREQQEAAAARQEQQRQQEAMREQQEAAAREEQQRQQEAMREQQERAREEQMRQQQDAVREQQEAAAARQEQQRQQQDSMRQQQQEAAGRQEQQRQQQGAMRQQQEAAGGQQQGLRQGGLREKQQNQESQRQQPRGKFRGQ